MSIFTGVGVALITPFTKDGVNFEECGKHIDYLLENKVDSIIVLGTTGEPSTMSTEEKIALVEFAVKRVNKRVPVIAGSGSNDTVKSAKFSLQCQEKGVDGLLIVTPYYNKCTQNGVLAHYKYISDAVNIPIIAYNVPTRTGFNMSPETASKLADIKNVVALKEASGDIDQVLDVASAVRGKLDFYSGDDSLTVPAMSIGAKGVISVAGNVVPKEMHLLTKYCKDNQFEQASEIHFRLAPLMKALFCEVNPIPCKKAVEFLGFKTGVPRLPLTDMEKPNADKLKQIMKNLKLI